MKRIIASLVISASAFSGQAFALVGGPFDMGSHGANLDRNSVYQATLSFKNGSGFCYFDPSSDITPRQGAPADSFDFIGSIDSRTVIYYKGVSYVGSCFGTSDSDARLIQAVINGTSELGFSATSSQQGQNGNQQTTAAVSNLIVQNGKNYIVNGEFIAKMTQSAPVLRFKGKGELAFVTPTGSSQIANLAYDAYSGLIGAIIAFISNSVVAGNGNDFGAIFTSGETAVATALTNLKPYLGADGINQTFEESEVIKMRVYGTRRYF